MDRPERLPLLLSSAILSRLAFVVGLCLGTVWLYKDVIPGYFVSDDLCHLYYVADLVRGEAPWRRFFTALLSPLIAAGFFYRPVLVAFFTGDFLLWGTQTVGWHVTSLVLHLGNVLLLWALVMRLAQPLRPSVAFFAGGAAATLFAVRPTSPETVAWLGGRIDSLSLLGMLIALLAYIRARGRWGGAYLVALGGFLFALGGKEAGVTLPGGLAALHVAGVIPLTPRQGESSRQAWWRQIISGVGPFAAVLALYFVWRFFLFGSFFRVYPNVPPVEPLHPDWWAVKLHALRVFLAPSPTLTPISASFAVLVVVSLTLGGLAARRSIAARRVWLFGLTWLLATLLPLAQQLAIASTGENARLLYIPSAALCVLLAAPLAVFGPAEQRGGGNLNVLGEAGVGVVCLLATFSLLLQPEFLEPWVVAGKNMRVMPAAIAERANNLSNGGFAVLLLPDHIGGAFFGRNGQGALMEPPVQPRLLSDRVLVVTPDTLVEHGPKLATTTQSFSYIERWCWSVEARRFERLPIPDHTPELWRLVWLSALQQSSCQHVAREVAEVSPGGR